MTITRSDLPFATCRLCGAKILFAVAPKQGGAPGETVRLPLNAVAPVYRVTGHEDARTVRAERERDCFVLHHATCRGLDKAKQP